MERTEQQNYIRNRNFITGMFAGYLRVVKWMVIGGFAFAATLLVLAFVSQFFYTSQPAGFVAGQKEVVSGPCDRTFFDQSLMRDVTDPDRKYCVITVLNPNGTTWTYRKIVPMNDNHWAELQDDG